MHDDETWKERGKEFSNMSTLFEELFTNRKESKKSMVLKNISVDGGKWLCYTVVMGSYLGVEKSFVILDVNFADQLWQFLKSGKLNVEGMMAMLKYH